MTDSSSKDDPHMAEMAGELMQAKMDAVRAPHTMTHLLQLGSFRMEIVPSRDIENSQKTPGIVTITIYTIFIILFIVFLSLTISKFRKRKV